MAQHNQHNQPNVQIISYQPLTELDPKSSQPARIKISLMPHQLTALHRMKEIESKPLFKTNIEDTNNYLNVKKTTVEINTSLGILGDKVGYGKTLTCLSLISDCKNVLSSQAKPLVPKIDVSVKNIQSRSLFGSKASSIVTVEQKRQEPLITEEEDEDENQENDDLEVLKTTLVITPHGSVLNQWKTTIENHTDLVCATIQTAKDLLAFCKRSSSVLDVLNLEKELYEKITQIEKDSVLAEKHARKSATKIRTNANRQQVDLDILDQVKKIEQDAKQKIDQAKKTYQTNRDAIAYASDRKSKKFERQEFVSQFKNIDVVLVSATFLKQFIDCHPWLTSFERIMVDEADTINIKKIIFTDLSANFVWLISATWPSMYQKNHRYNYAMPTCSETIKHIVVANNESYLKQSFELPPINYIVRAAKDPAHLDIYIRNMDLKATMLDAINADDIETVIKQMGGQSHTEKSLIEVFSREKEQQILVLNNKKTMITANEFLTHNEQRERIKLLDQKIEKINHQISGIKERITDLENKECSICLDNYENPLSLSCTHVFCAACLVHSLANINSKCPTCREEVQKDKLVYINNLYKGNNDVAAKKQKLKSKIEIVADIVKSNKNGKYLIFSNWNGTFEKIEKKLADIDITCSQIMGSARHMNKIIDSFKEGKIQVLMLNSSYNAAGINLECATDIILFHKLLPETETQTLGRSQRFGRTGSLNVHRICYSTEMPKDN